MISSRWSPNSDSIQANNPNSLTKKPHNFPRRSIERFAGTDGRVQVNWKNNPLPSSKGANPPPSRKGPKSDTFIIKRLWNQRTENFSNKFYEVPFQNMVNRLIALNTKSLTSEEMTISAKMYALWYYRSWLIMHPPKDLHMPEFQTRASDYPGWTQNEGEQLENTAIFALQWVEEADQPGEFSAIIPASQLVWPQLRSYVLRFANEHKDLKWGIVENPFDEFVIPDFCPPRPMLPLSPNKCLLCEVPDTVLTKEGSLLINKFLLENSQKYWISKG
jgi:hypothetical protein